jgi:dUTP pyrophosphatase
MDKLMFAKLKEGAKIPTKRDEDAGYDVYACFKEDDLIIYQGKTELVPTGIMSAFDKKYRILARERGSTGSIGLAIRAGVIDSGYRGEWFIALNNTSNNVIIITKDVEKVKSYDNIETGEQEIHYPYDKAICQVLLDEVPVVKEVEKTPEELKAIDSKRREGCLGDSGK